MLEILESQVCRGIDRRDEEKLETLFKSLKDLQSDILSREQLFGALKFLGIEESAAESLIRDAEMNDDCGLDFSEFKNFVFKSFGDKMYRSWAETLPLSVILADALPLPTTKNPLLSICALADTDSAIMDVVQAFAEGLAITLKSELEKLRASMTMADKQRTSSISGKFDVFTAKCGRIAQFREGLTELVGVPDLKFLSCMRAEHCDRKDSRRRFVTSNYHIDTCPAEEWNLVMADAEIQVELIRQAEAAGKLREGRRIPRINELLQLPVTQDAKLLEVEVIAIVLYTGPLFQRYNTVLRRFPVDDWLQMKEGGNLFSTTIHVLASAVQKVAGVMKLESGLRLYRGLGGTMILPDFFYHSDKGPNRKDAAGERSELQLDTFRVLLSPPLAVQTFRRRSEGQGFRGIMEYGFMSTTADKQVALHYSGIREGRPHPTVLEIQISAVDRGACIRDLSQYQKEVEYLWVPCSYLEPWGPQRMEVKKERTIGKVASQGIVVLIPVRMNMNLKTRTVEELESQKRDMHLASFRFQMRQLEMEILGGAEREFKVAGWDESNPPAWQLSVRGTVAGFVARCEAVYEQQESQPNSRFLETNVQDSGFYLRAVGEMVRALSTLALEGRTLLATVRARKPWETLNS